MQKNSLWKRDDSILRVLECCDGKVLVIDCKRLTMPVWVSTESLQDYARYDKEMNAEADGFPIPDTLTPNKARIMQQRFTAVAGILPFLSNERERSRMIAMAAKQLNVSKHTMRNYLCLYLAYQDKVVLAPRGRGDGVALSTTSKNIRWALNKFYYTKNRNSLRTAYTLMLKERYCDGHGGQGLPPLHVLLQLLVDCVNPAEVLFMRFSPDAIKQRIQHCLLSIDQFVHHRGEGVFQIAFSDGFHAAGADVLQVLLADPNRVLQTSGRIDVPFKNGAALAAAELTGEWVAALETRIVFSDVLFLCPLLNERTNRFKILPAHNRLVMIFHIELIALSVIGVPLKPEI